GDLLRTVHSGDDPTWPQPLMNRVQIGAAHFLQSYAFASGDKRSLVVFNLSRTTALDVTFAGDAPRGTVVLSRLASPLIDDDNEDAVHVATSERTLTAFDPAAPLTLPPYSMTVLKWERRTP